MRKAHLTAFSVRYLVSLNHCFSSETRDVLAVRDLHTVSVSSLAMIRTQKSFGRQEMTMDPEPQKIHIEKSSLTTSRRQCAATIETQICFKYTSNINTMLYAMLSSISGTSNDVIWSVLNLMFLCVSWCEPSFLSHIVAHRLSLSCHLQLSTMRSQKLFIIGAADAISMCILVWFYFHFFVVIFGMMSSRVKGVFFCRELIELMFLCVLLDQFVLTMGVLEITHKQWIE